MLSGRLEGLLQRCLQRGQGLVVTFDGPVQSSEPIHARACDVCILDTDLTGFPPTMIRVGSTEILLDDARDLADQLTAAGVDTRLHVWRGQLHVFPALYRLVRHARTALQLSGTFLTDTAARPRPQPDQLFPA